MEQAAVIAPQRAWGKGRLVAKPFAGRTRLAELYQEGCAKIRLPESFDGTMEAVLINSSGGLTGGDRMDWSFASGEGTQLTLTTQACEKIYKASADTAGVATRIEVGPGASVNWLPQETILFERASLSRRLEVDIADGGQFLAVEAVLLGRTAMGEAMETGLFQDCWRIRKSGALIHAENMRLSGDVGALTQGAAVLGGKVAFATIFYTGPDCEALVAGLRRLLGNASGGVSQYQVAGEDKLVARLAAKDGFALRKILIPLISHLRKGAPVPKVWTL
ncbi:urease accessory protein UreD [Pararhizobium antarcticum]|uniref:Urease accessory protein UreD n=1 Tax=Pararhizobium antarcticum TaxID=1798805 RepID=A0A657LTS1_9HYPH|nr:urease accessory protein UreD [Pararhizobium antarcticum]OJF97824.1 urease accessory protein UreD [Rhizobium sp. 58]OJF98256.1 urease accessory protein UreD [Pararhizobium antarcticum]